MKLWPVFALGMMVLAGTGGPAALAEDFSKNAPPQTWRSRAFTDPITRKRSADIHVSARFPFLIANHPTRIDLEVFCREGRRGLALTTWDVLSYGNLRARYRFDPDQVIGETTAEHASKGKTFAIADAETLLAAMRSSKLLTLQLISGDGESPVARFNVTGFDKAMRTLPCAASASL